MFEKKKQIYQSCLAAFLTFASKSCGPSSAANKPYGSCWQYTFPQYIYVLLAMKPELDLHENHGNRAWCNPISHPCGYCTTPWPTYGNRAWCNPMSHRMMQSPTDMLQSNESFVETLAKCWRTRRRRRTWHRSNLKRPPSGRGLIR